MPRTPLRGISMIMTSTPSTRLHHFDIIKGIAILLVVMGHVILFGMDNMDKCLPFCIIASIHMPLFFFISGWFSAKIDDRGKCVCPNILQRFVQLIIPTIVVGSLYMLAFNHLGRGHQDVSLSWFWLSTTKQGYWFTLVLFEIILIFALLRGVFMRLHRIWLQVTFSFLVAFAFLAAGHILPDFDRAFCLTNVGCYAFPFFIGAIARLHQDSFNRLTSGNIAITIAILILACHFAIIANADSLSYLIVSLSRYIAAPMIAIIAIAAIKPWSDAQFAHNTPGSFARIWCFLGSNSLGIYLLHYFLIFHIPGIDTFITPMLPAFTPITLISFFIAVAIVSATCGIIKVLKLSKLLSSLTLGL